MKRLLSLFLFLPLLSAASGTGLSFEDVKEPLKALAKSKTPAALAGLLLQAGEEKSVEAFIKGLPESEGDLANKLRSQVELHEGNIAGAIQALELMESADAWTKNQKKRLQELLALSSEMRRSSSGGVAVLLPKADDFLAQYIQPALDRALEKAEDFYGVSPSTPVRVEVQAGPSSFVFASLVPADSVERTGLLTAVREGRIVLLSPGAVPGGYRWLDAAAGALHRLCVLRLSGGQAPVWLLEGLARRGEDEWRREGDFSPSLADANRLAEAALVNPTTGTLLIPFARMEPSLRDLRRQEDVLLAQVQAADAVGFFLKKHGREELLALLKALRTRPRGEAFSSTVGVTEEEFEREWVESLESRSWTIVKGVLDRDVSLTRKEPAPAQDLAPFIRAGDALAGKRQWREALTQYRKGLALAPDNGLLLSRAARAAEEGEDGAETAEKYLKTAVEKNPFYVPPFASLGRLLYDDGRYEEAQRVLQEGLEIQPFHPRLHETLGLISMDVADTASARRSIQLSLRFDPDNPDLRNTLKNIPKGRR